MGKGKKRRNTAKTGDRALYKSKANHGRVESKGRSKGGEEDDPMYNDVDRFHNTRDEDFLKLDNDAEADSDDEEAELIQQEAVMDLGADAGDYSSDDDDEDEAQEDVMNEDVDDDASSENEILSSDDDDDDEELDMDDVRDWGRKVYGGDTADLEIGQDKEDAYLEEEAAKEVQESRMKDMKEEDFVLSDEDEEEEQDDDDVKLRLDEGKSTKRLSVKHDISTLSTSDKRRLLQKHHPELLPVVTHFAKSVRELNSTTMVATRALVDSEDGTAEAIGATKSGQKYLLTKALLQSSVALNLSVYLLLKAEQSAAETAAHDDPDSSMIKSHPIMTSLQNLNACSQKLSDKVEDKVEGLKDQVVSLAKAAALMKSGSLTAEDDDAESEDEDDGEGSASSSEELAESVEKDKKRAESHQDASSDESEVDNETKEELLRRNVLNDARYGLRPSEIKEPTARARQRGPSDFVDDDDVDKDEGKSKGRKALAATLNSIEQRSASRKRRAAPTGTQEKVDDHMEEDSEFRRGMEMMEAELGKIPSDEEDAERDDDADDLDDGDDDGGTGFYELVSKKSKSKKKNKKELYKVAPKFPRPESVVEGERAINKTILKNRGLVAHKPKLNRNPRVKKREQFRKAKIRRKGAVREVRTDEGHVYGGETTGIKSNLSKSRKLG